MAVIVQILENQIAILKNAVKYYAEADMNSLSLDSGFIAKDALKRVADLDTQHKEINDVHDALTANDTSPEALLEQVQKIVKDHIKE
jgi:hypothetical protein